MTNTTPVSIPLNGSDVVEYNGKCYSAIYVNQSYGYFIVPILNPDKDLGKWVKFDQCSLKYN